MTLPSNPLNEGIDNYGYRLRSGRTTATATVEAYLARIAALDSALAAYEFVATEQARIAAGGIDEMLAARIDLGPLMGVPVAIKDVVAVEEMPTTAGSTIDVADLIGAEGKFVRMLRRSGCIIIGKLATVELAGGNVGTNFKRRTPRNPWDRVQHRATSGSSSGSAVAVAAGMCGVAIGTDTGGSIRGPAAFCGVVGLKPTAGLWPTDGMFSMSRTFDTIGPLAASVKDTAIFWSALTGKAIPPPYRLRRARLGRPRDFFFENLEADVGLCMDRALAELRKAGAEIIEVDVPEVGESESIFDVIAYTEAVAGFGRERFAAASKHMSPEIADLIGHGLGNSAEEYIRAVWRHRELAASAGHLFQDIDGWIGPTKHHTAPEVPASFTTLDEYRALSALCGGATRPANVFGLCALSQPVQQFGAKFPVGLQLMCAGGAEGKLLSLGLAFEEVFGEPPRPDVTAFSRTTAAA